MNERGYTENSIRRLEEEKKKGRKAKRDGGMSECNMLKKGTKMALRK